MVEASHCMRCRTAESLAYEPSRATVSWQWGGDWKRETWHRETGQLGTISQGWTSRDLTRRHHIARVDIARLVSLCE